MKPNGKCEHLQPYNPRTTPIRILMHVMLWITKFWQWNSGDRKYVVLNGMSCLMTKPTLDNLPILSVNGGDDGEVLLMEVVCLLSDTKPQPWHQGGKKKRSASHFYAPPQRTKCHYFDFRDGKTKTLNRRVKPTPSCSWGCIHQFRLLLQWISVWSHLKTT